MTRIFLFKATLEPDSAIVVVVVVVWCDLVLKVRVGGGARRVGCSNCVVAFDEVVVVATVGSFRRGCTVDEVIFSGNYLLLSLVKLVKVVVASCDLVVAG